MSSGLLFVISGFAGSGKSTIAEGLIKKSDNYVLSVSATTRKPRITETDGQQYFFIERQAFEKGIANDEFLEHASYLDNYYGTPKVWVMDQLKSGKDVILEIEMQGGLQVKNKFPEAVLIFILPPDRFTLEKRLRLRDTETDEQIKKRLARAEEELEFLPRYDYMIINNDIEQSVDLLHNIVQSERHRVARNIENVNNFIHNFKNERL